MSFMPDNLVPLPTAPYEERPADLPLDVEECRTAIWRAEGNVTAAAGILKVSSSRLRAFVLRSDYLQREVTEARERLVDRAEEVVAEALKDPDRCDPMARFVLQSIGKGRGWGTGGGNSVNVKGPTGPISIRWEDGSELTVGASEPQMKTIEGEVIDG